MIDLALFAGHSKGDGPGVRAVLWVRGCERHCPGCGNRNFWRTSKNHMPVEMVAVKIFAQGAIEGITLCGGEPFLQATSLARLADLCHIQGLSVVTFTGFTLSELGTVPNADELLKQTDLLIDGPYKQEFPETRRHWVGSQNQIFHFLTGRYVSGVEYPHKGEKIIGPQNNLRGLFERI